MRKIILTGLLASVAFAATAQNNTSPLGKWKTLDDETGKPMTVTEVYMTKNGTMAAKIVENVGGQPAICNTCSGEHKGKPIVGMVTLWNLKEKDGVWGGGNGYKPSKDTSFKAKTIKVVDGGKKLEVTGCKAIFCQTATWVRVN